VAGTDNGVVMAVRALSFVAAGVLLTAQSTPDAVIAIVGATIIPMTSNAAVLPAHTVIFSGRQITTVGPATGTPVPATARRIDGRGKYLVPGLADMHVHLEYFERPDMLGLFLANGVTTVRNMDGRPYILEWKRRIGAGTHDRSVVS
jgi:adenine deaminase